MRGKTLVVFQILLRKYSLRCDVIIIFCAFTILIGASIIKEPGFYRNRKISEWALDATGLVCQGVVIPVCQIVIVYQALNLLWPTLRGSINLNPYLAFLLNFVLIDYFYYWNHRLLHGKKMWQWHMVHHTASKMDVIVTSRNSLLSHFLILYVWINGTFIYLLADPTFFVLSASLTAAMDLWRHSSLLLSRQNAFCRMISSIFITPHEHAWHHSKENLGINYGANLCVWDKLHGTYFSPISLPDSMGIKLNQGLLGKLIAPRSEVLL